MQILLRRLRTAQTALFLLIFFTAFAAGYFTGKHRSFALVRCRAANEMLVADLTRAVSRGVILEANLNLCKENK